MREFKPINNRIPFLKYLLLFSLCLLCVAVKPCLADITGQELMKITRIAQGGSLYAEVKNITIKSQGFVNVAPFIAVGLGTELPGVAGVEIQFSLTDYHTKDFRRRLEIAPLIPTMGQSFIVYDGEVGGGMFQGNRFRFSDSAAARHWGMMGFDTLNKVADGKYPATRKEDAVNAGKKYYVVEAKISDVDTVSYWINQNTFLIDKVTTTYNEKPLIEETRSDYRKVGCALLPYRVATKLQGQNMADTTVTEYDLLTEPAPAVFSITGD